METNKLITQNYDKFYKYYEYLINENNKYNLTAITEKEDVFIKHFEDSISLGNIFNLETKVKLLDVGSGAGFPAIPLKICYPNLEVVIIEPTLKRVNFMKNVIEMLNLKGIEVICGRAEDLANIYEEKFDLVCARAVASLSPLCELLTRYAKLNGFICAYKGFQAKDELSQCKNALNELNLKLNNIYEYDLRNDKGKRELIILKKEKRTNTKYPRRYAEIKKKPL